MQPSKADVERMAKAIHEAMCYRGTVTKVCRSDQGDARLMLESLARQGFSLARMTDG